jgi:NTP pyrophosphatase (non-canonical NTP hydrolase)
MMHPNEYQQLAGRTECDQEKSRARFMGDTSYSVESRLPLDLRPVRATHAVLGLAGEVGELAGALEKWIYYGKGDPDVTNLAEELGDCLWYIALMCNALGLPMEGVMEANIAKLRARYPNLYTDQDAAVRNLAAERQALEAKIKDTGLDFIDKYGSKGTAQPGAVSMTPEQYKENMRRLNEKFIEVPNEPPQLLGPLTCGEHDWQSLRQVVGPGGKCAVCGEVDPGA